MTTLENIIKGEAKGSFTSVYSLAKSHYTSINQFLKLESEKCQDLCWPSAPGVYVVWSQIGDEDEVIYIGMTGKFSKEGLMSATQGLKHRINRWTPYTFSSDRDQFSFDPLYEKGESRNKPPALGYEVNFDIRDIRVECFAFDRDSKVAPSFLEALFLQSFLFEFGRLPAGNNSF